MAYWVASPSLPLRVYGRMGKVRVCNSMTESRGGTYTCVLYGGVGPRTRVQGPAQKCIIMELF